MNQTIATLIALFILLTPSAEAGTLIRGSHVDLSRTDRVWVTTVGLEHATSKKALRWGLMQRPHLPSDHGMTFNFQEPGILSFWSFNCLIDVSVAYFDQNKVVREIYELEAHPELMDPQRPVLTVNDLERYPRDDPTVLFFQEHSAKSSIPARFALEMNKGWFAEHNVQPGDVAMWHTQSRVGFFIHTLDIGEYAPTEENPLILQFPGTYPHAVWMPNSFEDRDIAFLTSKFEIIRKQKLRGGANTPVTHKPVAASGLPAHYCLIAPKGWLKRNIIRGGVTVDGEMMLKVERESATVDNGAQEKKSAR